MANKRMHFAGNSAEPFLAEIIEKGYLFNKLFTGDGNMKKISRFDFNNDGMLFYPFPCRQQFRRRFGKTNGSVSPLSISSRQAGLFAGQTPISAGEVKEIRHAKITNLEIWTDSNGTWFWKATIKNIGTATLGDCYLLAQLGGSMFSVPQNKWSTPSGTSLNRGTLAPNQTVDVQNACRVAV